MENTTSFVKSTGDKEIHCVKIVYLQCNRSGAIRSATDETSSRKRRDKSQGIPFFLNQKFILQKKNTNVSFSCD